MGRLCHLQNRCGKIEGREQKIMRKKLLIIVVILFCLFSVSASIIIWNVYEKTMSGNNFLSSGAEMQIKQGDTELQADVEESFLSGDGKALKEKRKGYVMQITVENSGDSGEDFAGTL